MKKPKRFFVFGTIFVSLSLAAAGVLAYTITSTVDGSGGSISPSHFVEVDPNADQTFQLTPDPDYGVTDIEIDGLSEGPAFSYTFFNVTQDHSITAFFSPCDYLYPVMLDNSDPLYDGTLYQTITGAYTDASTTLGLNSFTLKLMGDVLFEEDLIFDQNVSLVLEGGYDCSFLESLTYTQIEGSMTIADGSVAPSYLIFQAPPLCEPGDPNNFPGNIEICDGLDNDCDGIADNGLTFDSDGDGFTSLDSCEGSADDCDDFDPNTHPGAIELCDGKDNNCDGQIDEGITPIDNDGDGYYSAESCPGSNTDCNDNDPTIYPGAPEIFGDTIDQNCDGNASGLLDPAVETYCVNCHGVNRINFIMHDNVQAPNGDPDCAACHAEFFTSILPSHYGRTVRSAGNNMAAGEIIVCLSCHDWHDPAEFDIGGAEIVWPKIQTVGYYNYTCDTCHEDRAAKHSATGHDHRVINPFCADCHTSDTSILGQPGNGTLVTQADVDALHSSDCFLCHAYNGTSIDPATVAQAIQDGENGIDVSCLACHGDAFPAIHAFIENHSNLVTTSGTSCADCHADAVVDATTHNGCSSCHDENYNTIGLAAGKTFDPGGDCTTCHTGTWSATHSTNTPDHSSLVTTSGTSCADCHADALIDATTHLSDCSNCHNADGSLRSYAIDQDFTTGGNCSTCHTGTWAATHSTNTPDHSSLVTTSGTSCGTCHADALIDATTHLSDCSNCHNADGSLRSYAIDQDFTTGGNCSTCHTDTWAATHSTNTPDHSSLVTTSGTSCADCHADALIDATTHLSDCSNCHNADGSLRSYAIDQDFTNGGNCSTCHGADLDIIHPNISAAHDATPGSDYVVIFEPGQHEPEMSGGAEIYADCQTCHNNNLVSVHASQCSTCHPTPYDTLGTWSGGCQQGGCHQTLHTNAGTGHQGAVTNDNCTFCHDSGSWVVDQTKCANCHTVNDPNDNIPPVTTSDVQPTYVLPTIIYFSVTDNGGQVFLGQTLYRVDGGAVQAGSSVFVSAVGLHEIEYWSVDQAGNEELPHHFANFENQTDVTPPSTTSNVKPVYDHKPANITLTATDDNGAGIISTYYSLDGGAAQEGISIFVPQYFPNSGQSGIVDHTLEYWSVDYSGNEETPHQTVNFKMVGGYGTLRLIWLDSDTTGSPCLDDPQASVRWEIRNSSTTIIGTDGCQSDPNWSGVNDIVVPVSAQFYYVDIFWSDSYVSDVLEEYPFVAVTVDDEIVELRY